MSVKRQSPHFNFDPEDREFTLEWWNGERKITVFIPVRAGRYLKIWGPYMTNEMEDGDLVGDDMLEKLFQWLEESP